jgi:hypothetical protein
MIKKMLKQAIKSIRREKNKKRPLSEGEKRPWDNHEKTT